VPLNEQRVKGYYKILVTIDKLTDIDAPLGQLTKYRLSISQNSHEALECRELCVGCSWPAASYQDL
jgi:hypothetical protein